MSSSAKNKENIPEHKKSSKDTKLLKSKLLLKECFPLKNQGLQHLNRSLDMSESTIKSSRKRQQIKSTSKKIRSKNTSECSLKQEQKTRKVIPIPLDDSFFKRPSNEKTVKPKNSRKQSEYVSYLIQAQRKAMNSLASIDNSQLSNCHQIQKLESLKNEQIHQLRSQMQGLKHRFERLESEHNMNEKQTIITLQDVSDKDHATIDLGILGKRNTENKTLTDNQSIFKTIEVQKKTEKDVADKYGSIIAEYEKMFAFYKERLEVCERDFETEKQREKLAQQQNQKLKFLIEGKQNQLKRKSQTFEAERNQLKEQIAILQKSLNKKNKDLISKNQELLLKESELKTKQQQLFLLKTREKYETCEIQNQKKQIIDKHTKKMSEKQQFWKKKLQSLENEKRENEKQHNLTLQSLNKQLEIWKSKSEKLERDRQNEKQKIVQKDEQLSSIKEQLESIQQGFQNERNNLKNEISSIQNLLTQKQTEWIKKEVEYLNEISKNKQKYEDQVDSLREQKMRIQTETTNQGHALEQKILTLESQLKIKSTNLSELTQKTQQNINGKNSEIEKLKAQIEKLKGILNQFTSEVKQIQSELTQNETFIEQLEKERDQLDHQLKQQRLSLNKERQSFAQERENLIYKQCKLQEQVKASQVIIEQKQSEINNFTKLSSKHKQESQLIVTSIKDEKQFLLKQVQSLSIQVQSLQQTKQAILSEKQQLLTKVWKLNEIITGNYDLAMELKERHNAQILNKDNAVIEALRQVQKVKAQKVVLEKILEEKSSQIAILRQQIIALTEEGQNKLQSIKDKHEAKLLNWKSQIEALNNLLHQKSQQIEQLTQIIDLKTSQINQKGQSITKLSQKLQDQQQKIRRLHNTISENNQHISSLKTQNKELSVQLETITQDLFTLTSRYEEAQMTQRQITQQKTQEINEIYQICEDNKRQIIESMRTKIDQLAQEIQQCDIKAKQKDQQISSLQKQLQTISTLKAQIQELKKKLLQSALASKGKITEMQKLEEKQEKLLQDLKDSQQYGKSLEQKILMLESKIKEMGEKVAHKEQSTDKLMSELSQSREKQTVLLQKISILKEENQSIISTYNYQLEQRKQIIEDLMKEKRQLYQKLNGDGF